jgi:mercuric ion transport protein
VTAAARYAYALLAWLFLGLLVIQVFLAGLGIFAGARNFAAHVDLGYLLHLAPILVLLAAALSRAGRRHWIWALALTVAVFFVPVMVYFRQDMPALAALHPVLAMLAFGLAVMVAINSVRALRSPSPQPAA